MYGENKKCTATKKIKDCYKTKHKAQRYAAQASRGSGAAVYVYQCEHCNEWHITGTDPAHAALVKSFYSFEL